MKSRFSEALNHINEKYIQEMVTGSRVRPAARWVAMAACLALMFGFGFGFFLKGNLEQKVVLPPIRESEFTMMTSVAVKYSFETAWQEACAVALVRIGNWLGEDELMTYYDAEVISCYKGNIEKNIILKQDGSSYGTIEGYPLFTHGNEMLVFLSPSTMGMYMDNCYWIIGGWTTVFRAVRDGDGEVFLYDTLNFLEIAVASTEMYTPLLEKKRCELTANYLRSDPYMEKYKSITQETVIPLDAFSELVKMAVELEG